MLRQTIYGVLVDDDGNLNKNERALKYIVDCARVVGVEVIEGETAINMPFIAEVMKRMEERGTK